MVALLLAGVVALLVEDWLRPLLGRAPTAAISLAVMLGVYHVTRKWLIGLRGE